MSLHPQWVRDDSWHRSKGGWLYYGSEANDVIRFPRDEKWPRFAAEIPPELAELLDAAQRKSLGVNYTPSVATRANLVRAGLRLYLNAADPERDPSDTIDGTASDIVDIVALPSPPHEPAMPKA